jgi:hypothetical protein
MNGGGVQGTGRVCVVLDATVQLPSWQISEGLSCRKDLGRG